MNRLRSTGALASQPLASASLDRAAQPEPEPAADAGLDAGRARRLPPAGGVVNGSGSNSITCSTPASGSAGKQSGASGTPSMSSAIQRRAAGSNVTASPCRRDRTVAGSSAGRRGAGRPHARRTCRVAGHPRQQFGHIGEARHRLLVDHEQGAGREADHAAGRPRSAWSARRCVSAGW